MEHTKNNVWKIGVVCGLSLTLMLLVISLNEIKALFVPTSLPTATNTITVSGTGDIVVVPDTATFTFGVRENASTVVAAQNAASTKANAAIDAMKNAGVAKEDIQTLSYNISPNYEYQTPPCVYTISANGASTNVCPTGKSVLNGYNVDETIQIKVRDITKAGTLFQTVGSLGVKSVDNLQFSVDKVDVVKDQARSKAIADAQTNANKLASELGVHLVRIVSFSENSYGAVQPMYYEANAKSVDSVAAPAPVIAQGQQNVTDTVSVTYEIR